MSLALNPRVRLSVMGGTGSVVLEMWNPDDEVWSRELRHWRF